MQVYCGIDWAERHHDVALVDQDGNLVAKKRLHETVEGSAQLVDMLAAAGDSADAPIPVAIETPRGLLVAALRAIVEGVVFGEAGQVSRGQVNADLQRVRQPRDPGTAPLVGRRAGRPSNSIRHTRSGSRTVRLPSGGYTAEGSARSRRHATLTTWTSRSSQSSRAGPSTVPAGFSRTCRRPTSSRLQGRPPETSLGDHISGEAPRWSMSY